MEKIEEEIKDMTPKLIKDLGSKLSNKGGTRKRKYGLYVCAYCDKEFETSMDSVRTGQTKSCGCLKAKSKITHGLTYNKFYKTWHNMTQRCTNPNHKAYKHYGGRGIIVCEEWLDVRNFVAWAEATYPNIEDATLDRIDNDKGYSPENCTWSDKTTQAINQRIMKNNKSGYVGIYYYKSNNKWAANIRINKILKQLGYFKIKEEAVQARDNYIIENKLPHPLSTHY